MKTRIDRGFIAPTPYPKMLILGKKDPVLGYDENKLKLKY
jgi:hypothetical protein